MAVKHYYCGKVCFNCIITVQNIKTYFNQSHKLLAIHTFLQHKFGPTVSETSLELHQFCLLLLCCETYYIISGLVRSKAHQMRISFWTVRTVQKSSLSIEPLKLFGREHFWSKFVLKKTKKTFLRKIWHFRKQKNIYKWWISFSMFTNCKFEILFEIKISSRCE